MTPEELRALPDAELSGKLAELRDELKKFETESSRRHNEDADVTQRRIAAAHQGHGHFSASELRYAAYNRCDCGAGLAYPKAIGIGGAWHCSAILRGTASRDVAHIRELPFSMYEIKSEDQPSANGQTTRPAGDPA